MHRHDRSTHHAAVSAHPDWQGFTFMSQNHQRSQDSTTSSLALPDDDDRAPMERLLSQAQVGDRVRIIVLHHVANDLAAMGLTSGMAVQIVSRAASGSVIVSLQERNLGVSAAIAQTIVVEPI